MHVHAYLVVRWLLGRLCLYTFFWCFFGKSTILKKDLLCGINNSKKARPFISGFSVGKKHVGAIAS